MRPTRDLARGDPDRRNHATQTRVDHTIHKNGPCKPMIKLENRHMTTPFPAPHNSSYHISWLLGHLDVSRRQRADHEASKQASTIGYPRACHSLAHDALLLFSATSQPSCVSYQSHLFSPSCAPLPVHACCDWSESQHEIIQRTSSCHNVAYPCDTWYRPARFRARTLPAQDRVQLPS